MADNSTIRLFGKKMQALRLEKNLTLEEIHQSTGIDLRTLQLYEDGKSEPMLEEMQVIANALGVRLKDLVDFD